jgi:hypothetical protein
LPHAAFSYQNRSNVVMNPYESPAKELNLEQLRGIPPEVEVEYDVTFDDLITFSWETLERQRGWLDLVILVIVPALALVDLWPFRRAIIREPESLLNFALLTKIVSAVLAGLIVAGLWRLAYRLGLMRRLSAGIIYATALFVGRARMVGRFRCRANPREISEITLARPYTFPISRVRKIKVSPALIGMPVTPLYTIVIPRRAFATPQDVDAFVAALEAYTGRSAEYLQPRETGIAVASGQTSE